MKNVALTEDAVDRIRGIHQLSEEYNKRVGKNHQERLLELMRSHIDEIEDLAGKNDAHCLVETGDLIILCLELLIENDISIDDTIYQCFQRYKKKLSGLIDEVKREG